MNTKQIFRREYNSEEDPCWIWDVVYKELRLFHYFRWSRFFKETKCPIIVNYGCGYGVITDVLFERYGHNATIVGTEYVVGSVHKNKRYSVINLDLNYPPKANFDAHISICSHVLQYLPMPYPALDFILRRTSRYAIIAVPFVKKPADSGMVYAFDESELAEFIQRKGFKIADRVYEGRLFTGLFKYALAVHARIREYFFGAKYRRRTYADTTFRRLIVLFGMLLTRMEWDSLFNYFERSGCIFICERRPA